MSEKRLKEKSQQEIDKVITAFLVSLITEMAECLILPSLACYLPLLQ